MKKKILCIVGRSGSGKSTAAEYIYHRYNIKTLESLTERKPRYEGEKGHTFISKGNRYCCRHQDLKGDNVYVIDPTGLKGLKEKFGDFYDVKSVYIHRIVNGVDKNRVKRDEGMYFLPNDYYDFHINNNNDFGFLESCLDNIVQGFFELK